MQPALSKLQKYYHIIEQPFYTCGSLSEIGHGWSRYPRHQNVKYLQLRFNKTREWQIPRRDSRLGSIRDRGCSRDRILLGERIKRRNDIIFARTTLGNKRNGCTRAKASLCTFNYRAGNSILIQSYPPSGKIHYAASRAHGRGFARSRVSHTSRINFRTRCMS